MKTKNRLLGVKLIHFGNLLKLIRCAYMLIIQLLLYTDYTGMYSIPKRLHETTGPFYTSLRILCVFLF